MVFSGALLEFLVVAITVAAVARVRVAARATFLWLLVFHGPADRSLGTTFFQSDLCDLKFTLTVACLIAAVTRTFIRHLPRRRKSCLRACKVASVFDYGNPAPYSPICRERVYRKVQMLLRHMRVLAPSRQTVGNVCVLVPNLRRGIPILRMLLMRYSTHMTSLCQWIPKHSIRGNRFYYMYRHRVIVEIWVCNRANDRT